MSLKQLHLDSSCPVSFATRHLWKNLWRVAPKRGPNSLAGQPQLLAKISLYAGSSLRAANSFTSYLLPFKRKFSCIMENLKLTQEKNWTPEIRNPDICQTNIVARNNRALITRCLVQTSGIKRWEDSIRGTVWAWGRELCSAVWSNINRWVDIWQHSCILVRMTYRYTCMHEHMLLCNEVRAKKYSCCRRAMRSKTDGLRTNPGLGTGLTAGPFRQSWLCDRRKISSPARSPKELKDGKYEWNPCFLALERKRGYHTTSVTWCAFKEGDG